MHGLLGLLAGTVLYLAEIFGCKACFAGMASSYRTLVSGLYRALVSGSYRALVFGSCNHKTCTSGPGSGNRKTCTSGPCPRLQFHTSILQASAEEKHRLPRRYAPRRDGVMFRRHSQLLRGGEGWQFGKLYCHGFTWCDDEGFTIYDYLTALIDYASGDAYAEFW